MHQHLVAAAVANDRAGRPGRKLLEKVAASEAILISTGANDWLESNGRAERVEGGFKVTAVKPLASGAPLGDLLITSAAYDDPQEGAPRSEEHTSELQSLMRISYAVFCLKKKKNSKPSETYNQNQN